MVRWKPSDALDHPELTLAMGRLSGKIEEVVDLDAVAQNLCRSSLVLVSGSLAYIGLLLPWLTASMGSALLFAEDAGRRPELPVSSNLIWRKISHQHVGGITTQVGLFGFFLLGGCNLDNKVGREIGHILDYSLRPAPVELSSVSDRHYTVSDRLRHKKVSLRVLYATHWCASGYGRRSLSAKELSSAFHLPVPMQPVEALGELWLQGGVFERMTPLSLFNAILDRTLSMIAPILPPPEAGLVSLPVAPSMVPALGVMLPLIGKYLVHSWVNAALVTEKAGKADNAGAPTQLWDQRVTLVLAVPVRILNIVRKALFWCYCGNLMCSLATFLASCAGPCWAAGLVEIRGLQRIAFKTEPPLRRLRGGVFFNLSRNATAGADVIRQNTLSTWWEWNKGSALVFWRWGTLDSMMDARDGKKIFVLGDLTRFRRAQQAPKADDVKKVAVRLWNVCMKHYIHPGHVTSLTHSFYVYKDWVSLEQFNIWMVYDGTGCGLNAALWAPSFWMPTASTALRRLSFYSYCVDGDLGEMFLTFSLDPEIRPYAGVDLRTVHETIEALNNLSDGPKFIHSWERWGRLFMGLCPSPYLAIQYLYLALEFAMRNWRCPKNPLRWDKVILNLPGDPKFDPSQPMVMKWNEIVERIAGDIVGFLDDLRLSGFSIENAWAVSQFILSRLQYLGIQDAPRKRRPHSQTPGVWAGAIFRITPERISKSISQAKWDKEADMVDDLLDRFQTDERPKLEHRDLERKRGFLGHVSMTFPALIPYMKGFHLTIDSWRDFRPTRGWKMNE
jgi:hypothetical protein